MAAAARAGARPRPCARGRARAVHARVRAVAAGSGTESGTRADGASATHLTGLRRSELEAWTAGALPEGLATPARARALWRALYAASTNPDAVWPATAESLVAAGVGGKYVAAAAAAGAVGGGALERVGAHTAADGTTKLLFRLRQPPRTAARGGEARSAAAAEGLVEAVIIPVERTGRRTVCVSSQLGCAMNCQFCHTARMGLRANLSAAHIVEQVVEAKRFVAEQERALADAGEKDGEDDAGGAGAPVRTSSWNCVFMGMGEPLHNLEEVLRAVDILTDDAGVALPRRRVTVSTSGLVPQIRELRARSPAALAVSLNATDDETRDWLMPVNRKHGLEELMATLAELYPRGEGSGPGTKKKKRARDSVLLEYVLLRGVNDSEADADRFADLLARHAVCAKVNLIQFNENPGAPGLLATSADAVRAFQAMLGERGVVATVRVSRGDDESAACGMLGQLEQRRREEANAEEARAQAASSGAGEGAHVEGSGETGYAWPAPPRLEPPARLADAVRGWDAV